MTLALLIVAALTLIAALAGARFAYPTYRELRQRPDLVLTVTATGSPVIGWADLRFELTNHGMGKARDWKVVVESTGNLVKLSSTVALPPGAREQAVADGNRIDWQARDASDVIGRDLSRQLACQTTKFVVPASTVARYSIAADRMDQREGQVRVAWSGWEPLVEVK